MKKARFRRKNKASGGILTKRGARAALAAAALLVGVIMLQGLFHSEAPAAGPPGTYDAEPVPAPSESPVEVELTDFDAGVGESIRLELLNVSVSGAEAVDLSGLAPRVLIYHTHTTEAYTPTGKYSYTASSEWRTRENDRNVVAAGEKLASLLQEKYGITTLHDVTDHEPPKLDTAYERSLVTMLQYKKQYPSLTLFIDLHRDDGGTSASGSNDYVVIDGKEVARMMFVVGTGEGATGTGYDEMPDFASNYALAKAVTERLRQFNERLARDIRVKKSRYNQHVSNQCLLVELGHNRNTLEQALNAVDYLAQAIADVAGIAYEQDAVQTIYQFTP